MEGKVKLYIEDKVAKIVLNDAENYNPLNKEMGKELLGVLEKLRDNRNVFRQSLSELLDGRNKGVLLSNLD